MSQKEAQQKSLQKAKEELKKIDLTTQCRLLDLPSPDNNNLQLRIFGIDMTLDLSNLKLIITENNEPAKLSDHILLLHYLLNNKPIIPTQEEITFRQLPGGQFYWQPFLSRTANPLLGRIGNNPDLLKKNLGRFDWEPVSMGDLGAKIHGLGKLHVTLIYHKGDDEFGPAIDILFNSCIKDVFTAEDTAVLASRICLGLL